MDSDHKTNGQPHHAPRQRLNQSATPPTSEDAACADTAASEASQNIPGPACAAGPEFLTEGNEGSEVRPGEFCPLPSDHHIDHSDALHLTAPRLDISEVDSLRGIEAMFSSIRDTLREEFEQLVDSQAEAGWPDLLAVQQIFNGILGSATAIQSIVQEYDTAVTIAGAMRGGKR